MTMVNALLSKIDDRRIFLTYQVSAFGLRDFSFIIGKVIEKDGNDFLVLSNISWRFFVSDFNKFMNFLTIFKLNFIWLLNT